MASRDLQRNASDPKQVRFAERFAKRQVERQGAALHAIMQLPIGRLFLWGLLGRLGIDETVYDHSGSTMYFKEGRRNAGLELKAAMLEADEDMYQLMEREMRALARSEQLEIAGVQTRSATEEIDG
jgi:hypothetical protein